MMNWIKTWLNKESQTERDFRDKARLCKPCATFCGDDICMKVGCLNMDMRANYLRLKLLVRRLEERGYDFTSIQIEIEEPKTAQIINLNDFRK